MPKGKGYGTNLGIKKAFNSLFSNGSSKRGAKGSPNLKDAAAVIKKRRKRRKSMLEDIDK